MKKRKSDSKSDIPSFGLNHHFEIEAIYFAVLIQRWHQAEVGAVGTYYLLGFWKVQRESETSKEFTRFESFLS